MYKYIVMHAIEDTNVKQHSWSTLVCDSVNMPLLIWKIEVQSKFFISVTPSMQSDKVFGKLLYILPVNSENMKNMAIIIFVAEFRFRRVKFDLLRSLGIWYITWLDTVLLSTSLRHKYLTLTTEWRKGLCWLMLQSIVGHLQRRNGMANGHGSGKASLTCRHSGRRVKGKLGSEIKYSRYSSCNLPQIPLPNSKWATATHDSFTFPNLHPRTQEVLGRTFRYETHRYCSWA